jgi:RNA polymerase sigma factor (sigma-70 family)
VRFPSIAVLRTQSDDRLVALARAGNEQAFEAIVERYRRPLLRHAERLLADIGAEDAVQQAFLSAWTALQRGDDVRELNAWLHRILHNVALNALRGAKRGDHAELHENVAAGVAPEDELERRMAMRRTLADVAALPERQREALLRVAVQGRSQAEVARTLGLSHGAVGQLVMRGRRTLRAAATALTPQWLVNWVATLGTEGQQATSATLGKVAAVVAVAGAATTGPVLIEHRDDHPRPVAEARAADDRSAPKRTELPGGGARIEPEEGLERSGSGSAGSGSGGSRSSGSGSSGTSDSGTSGSGTSGTSDSGTSDSGTSDSGTSDSGTSGSGTSGSGTSGSGTSGSGTSGSGTSGSGTSGSGTSGSGTSGSGTSGSGTSDSGTSDSGTSVSGTSGTLTGDSGTSGSGTSGSGTSDTSGTSGSGDGSG